MASLWRRAMVYLGLVDDDEYEYDYDYYDEEPQRAPARGPVTASQGAARPAESYAAVRTMPPEETSSLPAPRRPSVVRTMPQVSPKVHVVEPAGFNDAQEVGDRLKVMQPVILNLQGLDRDLQRRLIDFASGLTYALGGAMSRVHEEVFLLTPANVEVSPEEKERLQARGLYSRP
ncbi:MAG TPA: cell division protein SepF [Acidimicrobiia bacterium]|nr:cell division protein SepF [Acidimicrobiia bacterium]